MSPRTVGIVSCTAHKRDRPMRAENLYCSELFYKSRRYAQANYDAWLILSAKHGLIRPCEVVEPYDRKLTTLSQFQRAALVECVSRQFASMVADAKVQLSSLCREDYDSMLDETGIPYQREPRFTLPIGMKLEALALATDPYTSQPLLDSTYGIIGRLAQKVGLRRLGDLLGHDMPDSGIYLFFDERENALEERQSVADREGRHAWRSFGFKGFAAQQNEDTLWDSIRRGEPSELHLPTSHRTQPNKRKTCACR